MFITGLPALDAFFQLNNRSYKFKYEGASQADFFVATEAIAFNTEAFDPENDAVEDIGALTIGSDFDLEFACFNGKFFILLSQTCYELDQSSKRAEMTLTYYILGVAEGWKNFGRLLAYSMLPENQINWPKNETPPIGYVVEDTDGDDDDDDDDDDDE